MVSALLVLGAVVLVVVAARSSSITSAAVDDIFRRSNPAAFVLAFGLMTTGLVFLAFRWRALMTEPERVTILPLTSIFTVGTLLNYVLPGPVGEFAAAALVARRFGVSGEMALAASVHGRFLGLTVAGAAAGILFVTTDMPVPDGMHRWIGLATLAISVGAVGLGVMSAWPVLLRELSARTLGRVPFLSFVDVSLQRLASSLGAVGRLGKRRYALGAWWALCGHASVVGGVAIAAYGLGAHPDPAGLAFTYTVATAGAVVLFAFPGSQVGWDAMFASLLVATAGLEVPDALAVALLVRVQQLFTVLLGGVALARATRHGDDSDPAIG